MGTIDSCSIGVLIEEYKAEPNSEDPRKETMTITSAINREASLVARGRFDGAKVKRLDATADEVGEATGVEARLERIDATLAEITAFMISSEKGEEADSVGGVETDNVLPLATRLARKHQTKEA